MSSAFEIGRSCDALQPHPQVTGFDRLKSQMEAGWTTPSRRCWLQVCDFGGQQKGAKRAVHSQVQWEECVKNRPAPILVRRHFIPKGAKIIATISLAIIVLGNLGVVAPIAKADELVFAGDQPGGQVQIVIGPAVHVFDLSDAPLDTLLINGASIPFNGLMNINDAAGNTTDPSTGDWLFSSGSLTISSGGTALVTAQLLGGELSMGGTPTFIGVLDPNGTSFGGSLASEGPLEGGVGGAKTQILLKVPILPGVNDFVGTALSSGAVLVTPEPSSLLLLGIGLVALFTWKSSRASAIVRP